MRKRELHAIRKRAARAALTERWGGDKRTPSKQVRVDADAADTDDETEVETRRGFAIVWNANGAWRVEVRRGRVTRLA